jgi:uncharacterized protein DUF2784
VTLGYSILAALVVVAHLLFVAFAVGGGLLVLRWPRLMWLHVPAVVWAAFVELSGRICPLTPLENVLRARAGLGRYAGDFIAQYVLPVLYPAGLTRDVQMCVGLVVIAVNVAAYAWLIRRRVVRGVRRT